MKTTVEISNGARIYTWTLVNDEMFLENERGETITISPKDFFDLYDDYFRGNFFNEDTN